MTSLIAWTGVDSHTTASLYLASDSRISWGRAHSWDTGRKVFACREHPDVFGYCGDVLFPALVLGQATVLADDGLLFSAAQSGDEKHASLVRFVERCFDQLPDAERRAFSILHGTRAGVGMPSHFRMWHITWTPVQGWKGTELNLPSESAVVIALGSGAPNVRQKVSQWTASEAGRTSRAVFGAFCDALRSRVDPLTGGAPQLVGLYRISAARTFGVIYESERFLLGAPVGGDAASGSVEWRNELFERCDPASLVPLEGAQLQPRPASLR